jgi:hypothetical protein
VSLFVVYRARRRCAEIENARLIQRLYLRFAHVRSDVSFASILAHLTARARARARACIRYASRVADNVVFIAAIRRNPSRAANSSRFIGDREAERKPSGTLC